jgi:hypothetical protein
MLRRQRGRAALQSSPDNIIFRVGVFAESSSDPEDAQLKNASHALSGTWSIPKGNCNWVHCENIPWGR